MGAQFVPWSFSRPCLQALYANPREELAIAVSALNGGLHEAAPFPAGLGACRKSSIFLQAFSCQAPSLT